MLRVFTGFLLLIVLPFYITEYEQSENFAIQTDTYADIRIADTAHNSRNSLDWAGTYAGVTPCAGCEGIETELSITYGRSFELSTKYIGESDSTFQTSGSFTWNENGSIIQLDIEDKSMPVEYIVQENRLVQLDIDGNRITGDFGERYTLSMKSPVITDRYWKLISINQAEIDHSNAGSHQPHIIFHQIDNRVSGNGGCNSFMGSYRINGSNQIILSNMASTNATCDLSLYEDSLFRILASVHSFSVRGNMLYLHSNGNQEALSFVESSAVD